eukprot:CAMPEP_0168319154 /NCGR_PEP_ID=MMETSP0213-20121227/890_1 /TAXON_ID=151035 /ORGANISM="Euplotes harpa, Strain FSP1.4" /LENGTH=94 /DNA_ID=CAMNT_0008320327 /DNA_START=380 /DNA_END=664 /DNA_ORIENTATION=+
MNANHKVANKQNVFKAAEPFSGVGNIEKHFEDIYENEDVSRPSTIVPTNLKYNPDRRAMQNYESGKHKNLFKTPKKVQINLNIDEDDNDKYNEE